MNLLKKNFLKSFSVLGVFLGKNSLKTAVFSKKYYNFLIKL